MDAWHRAALGRSSHRSRAPGTTRCSSAAGGRAERAALVGRSSPSRSERAGTSGQGAAGALQGANPHGAPCLLLAFMSAFMGKSVSPLFNPSPTRAGQVVSCRSVSLQKALASRCCVPSSLCVPAGCGSARQRVGEQLFSAVLGFVTDEESTTSLPGADYALMMIEVWGLEQNQLTVVSGWFISLEEF